MSLRKLGCDRFLAARTRDMHIYLLQFLYDNRGWRWSRSLHSVTIRCKKRKLLDWGVVGPPY